MNLAESTVWSPPTVSDLDGRPPYVAVIGNSGSGKSTLVRRLASDLFGDQPHAAIDERQTHHPFLDQLFYNPRDFAFELQLSFMIQRVLIIKRWLSTGKPLVMERSHLDDIIFARHLRNSNLISAQQYHAYSGLWDELAHRVPPPHCVIALDVDPATSVERVTRAEKLGLRPKEFPSELHKREWITTWAALYRARFVELLSDPLLAGFRVFSETDAYTSIRDYVATQIIGGSA